MTRRKRYSAEFKREALRRANEVGVTDVLVAEELGINARNLRNWRDAAEGEGDFVIDDETRKSLMDYAASNEAMKDPIEVAEAVLHQMSSDAPKRRYMVTPNAEQAAETIRVAMQRTLQLNEGQPYSYSRDELVALLDELLKTN